MHTVTVEEAQQKLADLIQKLSPGEELLITRDHHPVAKLVAEPSLSITARTPGSAKGKLTIVADDDEHLADFNDYIP